MLPHNGVQIVTIMKEERNHTLTLQGRISTVTTLSLQLNLLLVWIDSESYGRTTSLHGQYEYRRICDRTNFIRMASYRAMGAVDCS